MTPEQFNKLDEQKKKFLACNDEKLCEKWDDFFKYELFTIDKFFVEVKIGQMHHFKKQIVAYSLQEVPTMYGATVWASLNLTPCN